MIIKFDKAFEKEIGKLKDSPVRESIIETIFEVEKAKNLFEVKNLKKLKGFRKCYRIRIGDYRIGIFYEGRHVEFIRFGHRKEFYRYFP